MFTLAADYLEKSWQRCPGVLREFSWIFSFPSLEVFQDLGGSPYNQGIFPLNNLESTSGKNFKKEKEKILSGYCKQVSAISKWFFQDLE
jgi:hypothetical protein